jgi:hypothetical protein
MPLNVLSCPMLTAPLQACVAPLCILLSFHGDSAKPFAPLRVLASLWQSSPCPSVSPLSPWFNSSGEPANHFSVASLRRNLSHSFVSSFSEPANPFVHLRAFASSRQSSPCPSESLLSLLFQIVSLRTLFDSKKCLLFRCISNLKNYKLQTTNYKLSPCPSVSPLSPWFKILVSLRTNFFAFLRALASLWQILSVHLRAPVSLWFNIPEHPRINFTLT